MSLFLGFAILVLGIGEEDGEGGVFGYWGFFSDMGQPFARSSATGGDGGNTEYRLSMWWGPAQGSSRGTSLIATIFSNEIVLCVMPQARVLHHF